MEATNRSKVRSTQLGSDFQRPVPMGLAVKASTERGYGIELKVLEVVRGPHAQEAIPSDPIDEDPMPGGMEYLSVTIRFAYYCKAKGSPDSNAAYRVSGDSFQTASADGSSKYDVLEVGSEFKRGLVGRSIPVGEAMEGTLVFRIPQKEKDPLLVFHRRHAHSDFVLTSTWQPFWFRLSTADPMAIDDSCAECRP